MKDALADAPAIPFRVPPGIELVSVDLHSGMPATPGAPGAILEAFKPGTEPIGNEQALGPRRASRSTPIPPARTPRLPQGRVGCIELIDSPE